MKNTVFFRILPLAIFGLIISSNSRKAPPSGNTGSPSDGKSCGNSNCHNTTDVATTNMISHDIPSEGYEPGKEYNVNVTVAKTGRSKFGFQFSPQLSDGKLAGTLATVNSNTAITADKKYISHAARQTSGSGGSKTWPFKWTAPAAGTGKVTFYVAGNASNNMGDEPGDEIQTSSEEINEKGVASGIFSVNSHTGFSFYPNPIQASLYLRSDEPGRVKIVNTNGMEVMVFDIKKGNSERDLSSLKNGIYFISFLNGNQELRNQTLIKY